MFTEWKIKSTAFCQEHTHVLRMSIRCLLLRNGVALSIDGVQRPLF